MNYTNQYHLPQWEKSDRILMDDFNQMSLDLEASLAKTAQDAASSAADAKSTANSALVKANAAQNSASNAYSPSFMPFAVGSYSGNGDTLQISLGFKPSFAIVAEQIPFTPTPASTLAVTGVAVAGPSGNMSPILLFSDSGFTVTFKANMYPQVNSSGTTYNYIAFR